MLVVTGKLRPALPTLEAELDDGRVVLVDNPDWEAGQSTSLQAGVTAADELEVDAIVVGLGDSRASSPRVARRRRLGVADRRRQLPRRSTQSGPPPPLGLAPAPPVG